MPNVPGLSGQSPKKNQKPRKARKTRRRPRLRRTRRRRRTRDQLPLPRVERNERAVRRKRRKLSPRLLRRPSSEKDFVQILILTSIRSEWSTEPVDHETYRQHRWMDKNYASSALPAATFISLCPLRPHITPKIFCQQIDARWCWSTSHLRCGGLTGETFAPTRGFLPNQNSISSFAPTRGSLPNQLEFNIQSIAPGEPHAGIATGNPDDTSSDEAADQLACEIIDDYMSGEACLHTISFPQNICSTHMLLSTVPCNEPKAESAKRTGKIASMCCRLRKGGF